MKTRRWTLGLIGAACVLVFIFVGFRRVVATQAVVPSVSQLRFQLIGNEPIAGPDGYSLVKDWSVLMFRDRKSNECYVVFKHGSLITASNVAACPEKER